MNYVLVNKRAFNLDLVTIWEFEPGAPPLGSTSEEAEEEGTLEAQLLLHFINSEYPFELRGNEAKSMYRYLLRNCDQPGL